MSGTVIFLPHGGGPLPVMGHETHQDLAQFLRSLGRKIDGCEAILVFTAHWEADRVTLSGQENPDLLFDYYGFPPETYKYSYPAPGAPKLAKEVSSLLDRAGIACGIDTKRGYDHGTFIPMMLMRPAADIPILQASILNSLDPSAHIDFGAALAPLLERDIAIIGSGLSFHNLDAFFGRGAAAAAGAQGSEDFDAWLNDTIVAPGPTAEERRARLIDWASAPAARHCHPREEHLLPLHVCYGAAAAAGLAGANIYNGSLQGHRLSGFEWQ